MSFKPLWITILIVFSIVHVELCTSIWSYITLVSPTRESILNELSGSVFFWPTVFVHDVIINALLILPGAILVAIWVPLSNWTLALTYGATMYIWPYHITAVEFGLPLAFYMHPSVLIAVVTLIFLPGTLTLWVKRGLRNAA